MKKTWATRYKEKPAPEEREVVVIGHMYEILNENGFDGKTRKRILWYLTSRVQSDVRREKGEAL